MKRGFLRYWWVGVLTLFTALSLVFLFGWLKYAGFSEAYKVSSSNFELRVLQKRTLLFNYTYLFQSCNTRNRECKDVFEYTSDPDAVNEMIRIVDNSTGYIKSNRIFGITRDAGTTWTFSELDTILRMSEDASNCTFIRDLNIEANGDGWMKLRSCSKAQPKSLVTKDYGVTWE